MKKILFGILSFFVIVGVIYTVATHRASKPSDLLRESAQAEEIDRVLTATIEDGDTFGTISTKIGISPETTAAILDASADVYDFSTIRLGKHLKFTFDHETGVPYKLSYEPNTEELVTVLFRDGTWIASIEPIVYDVRERTISGTIESSLYETALEKDFDVRVIIALAEVFQWQVDFALDVRSGDTFTMVYEERYRDNTYIMPGAVLAAQFVNDGTAYTGYAFTDSDGSEGYYAPDGSSLQKIFLKSPLKYKYISSGFQAARYNPVIHKVTSHYAIDYAANYGTPASSVGDGTVTFAGWRTGYGYSVDVRHNSTYLTRYGHFSKLAVQSGDHVSQGDTVGYVGSTGWSTGPHLHYEVHKNGTPVNPLTMDLPSDKSLAENRMPAFQEFISRFSF